MVTKSILQKPPDSNETRLAALADESCDCRMRANRVIAELSAIAFSDISKVFDSKGRTLPLDKIPPNTRRAIASYKVRLRTRTRTDPNGKKVRESFEMISVRLHSKLPALHALGRYLGMFRERPAPTLERTPVALQLATQKAGRSR
jgi:hypothetical protein